ncbi:MAG: translation initiation factor eIF-1A [Acidilobaceae archaeon]
MIEREGGESKEIPLPSENEGTLVCVVRRIVGAGFAEVVCTDNEIYMARIPGKMRRKVWIKEGDVVLFMPWGTRDKKGEILHKYEKSDIKTLIESGVLPEELLEVAQS